MADFGNSGTRTVTVFNANVSVNGTAGEFLDYLLVASGGMPAFTYTCADRSPISRSDQFPGHPKSKYSWKLKKAGEALPLIVAADRDGFDSYSVSMSFLGAIGYDLTINLCSSDATVKQVVQQISFKSNDGTDFCAESLGVTFV